MTQHPNLIWTKRRIIDAIKDFNDQYGRPPGQLDWSPSQARAAGDQERADRYVTDEIWPSTQTVIDRFGLWSKALKAAGFKPLRVGRPRKTS